MLHGANPSAIRKRVPRTMGVVDQVVRALHPRNRLATVLGFVGGGAVPAASYVEAHYGLDPSLPLYTQVTAWAVLGGLVFSAKTVFSWAALAFHDRWKAAGFVVLLEGLMITSRVPVLPLVLLTILVAINGIATGCTLGLDRSRSSSVLDREPCSVRLPAAPALRAERVSSRAPVVVGSSVAPRALRRAGAPTPQGQLEFNRPAAS